MVVVSVQSRCDPSSVTISPSIPTNPSKQMDPSLSHNAIHDSAPVDAKAISTVPGLDTVPLLPARSPEMLQADTAKDLEFAWSNVAPEQLDGLEDIELMRLLKRRNEGDTERTPVWLLEGLETVKGPVEWLLKVHPSV